MDLTFLGIARQKFMKNFLQMYHFHEKNGRLQLHAFACPVGSDLQIILTGGESHIGAVAIATPESFCQNSQVPPHREGALALSMAERLSKILKCHVAVSAGIHFDNITREEIGIIGKMTDNLTFSIVEAFLGARGNQDAVAGFEAGPFRPAEFDK